MNCINKVKTAFRKMDIFGSNQFLRYREEPRFGTITGGVVTIGLIVLFFSFFLGSALNTINKQNVQFSESKYEFQNPPYASFAANKSKFIFGIGLQYHNLNASVRYFDIVLLALNYNKGVLLNSTQLALAPCERSQWAYVNDLGATNYDQLNLQTYLCPSSNILLQLQGKYTSQIFKFMKVSLRKCNDSLDPSRPCAGDAYINNYISKYATFNLNFYFMNSVINSGDLTPVSYYLEDRNYYSFATAQSISSNVYLSEHQITTDNSIFPNKDQSTDKVLVVEDLADIRTSNNINNEYVKIFIRKSPSYYISNRNYQKLDAFFSYIGGLFNFAIFACIIMSFYSEASYELEMGDQLFYYDEKQPLDSNSFNIIYYLMYLPYQILRKLNIKVPWERMERYYECREEIENHLNVALLMNKITYLEKCMNIIFEDHQIRAIYLQHKPTVKQAEQLRLNHGLNKLIHQNYFQAEEGIDVDKLQHQFTHKGSKKSKSQKYLQSQIAEGSQKTLRSEVQKIEINELPLKRKSQEDKKKEEDQKENKHFDFLKQFLGGSNKSDNENIQGQVQSENKIGSAEQLAYMDSVSSEKSQQSLDMNKIISALFQNVINKKDEQKMQRQNQQFGQIPEIKISSPIKNNENLKKSVFKEERIEENLQFINSTANDLKQLEAQAKKGDALSKKIFEKLNTQITKDQLIVFSEIVRLAKSKSTTKSTKKMNKQDEILESEEREMKPERKQYLDIVLQTNDRYEPHAQF